MWVFLKCRFWWRCIRYALRGLRGQPGHRRLIPPRIFLTPYYTYRISLQKSVYMILYLRARQAGNPAAAAVQRRCHFNYRAALSAARAQDHLAGRLTW